jgi:hypothetical protein
MKVHLIKDGDVGKDTFSEVVDLLQAISGPIEFYYDSNNIVNFTEDDVIEKKVPNEKKFGQSIQAYAEVENAKYLFPFIDDG